MLAAEPLKIHMDQNHKLNKGSGTPFYDPTPYRYSGAPFHVVIGYQIVIFFYPYTKITIGFNI